MPDPDDSNSDDRPEKSDDDDNGMSASFRFRMYPETKERIESMADRLGVSQGEVIRSLISDQSLPDRRKKAPPGIRELNREIARIGNNLNQIARAVNTYKTKSDLAQISTALVTIERQIESLREQALDPNTSLDGDRE